MNICLFSNDEISKPLPIKDERAQHIIKILHKKAGDSFSAGVINGKAGIAKISEITEKEIHFNFEATSEGKTLFPLKMIIGFPRPIQLKRLLRDIAALGVCQVHLTGTELGEKSYMQSNLVEHGTAWKMLLDGTIQAASTHVPELFLHQNLTDCIKCLENDEFSSKSVKLCLDNINPDGSLVSILEKNRSSKNPKTNFIAAIGSERGWTNRERTFLEEKGFLRCGMGARVMRTETAATVSASVISAYAGWFED